MSEGSVISINENDEKDFNLVAKSLVTKDSKKEALGQLILFKDFLKEQSKTNKHIR